MTEKDVPKVTRIERSAYAFPWTEGIFSDCIRIGYFFTASEEKK